MGVVVRLLASCRMGFLELHYIALALELFNHEGVVVVTGHWIYNVGLLKRFNRLSKLINRCFLFYFLLFCHRLWLCLHFSVRLLYVLVA